MINKELPIDRLAQAIIDEEIDLGFWADCEYRGRSNKESNKRTLQKILDMCDLELVNKID